jgi:hypothetical protein
VLSRELRETSGVAVGQLNAGVLWTHNDGNSDLFALGLDGSILDRFDVPRLRDWEALEIAPCELAGSCLYLADTGDNAEGRPDGDIRLLRLTEPEVARTAPPSGQASITPRTDVFPIRLPEGPRDVEALFVLPGEVPYVVTKGGSAPITVYRYPAPLRPDTVTLVEVQRLTEGLVSAAGPGNRRLRVT